MVAAGMTGLFVLDTLWFINCEQLSNVVVPSPSRFKHSKKATRKDEFSKALEAASSYDRRT